MRDSAGTRLMQKLKRKQTIITRRGFYRHFECLYSPWYGNFIATKLIDETLNHSFITYLSSKRNVMFEIGNFMRKQNHVTNKNEWKVISEPYTHL